MKQKKKKKEVMVRISVTDQSKTRLFLTSLQSKQTVIASVKKKRKNRLMSYTDNKAHKHAASTHQQNVDYKIEFLEVKHSVISLYVLPV